MVDDADIELHDAILCNYTIDANNRLVIVILDVYRKPTDTKRIRTKIIFSDVISAVSTCNLTCMKDNSEAGNVNYWVRGRGGSATYIYLVEGYIEVVAASHVVEFSE